MAKVISVSRGGMAIHITEKNVTGFLPSRALAVSVATTGTALFGFYFFAFALETWSEGRIGPTILLAFIPFFMWVVVFLNAGFALRKIERPWRYQRVPGMPLKVR